MCNRGRRPHCAGLNLQTASYTYGPPRSRASSFLPVGSQGLQGRVYLLDSNGISDFDLPTENPRELAERIEQVLIFLLAAVCEVRNLQGVAYDGHRQLVQARARGERIADTRHEAGFSRQNPSCDAFHDKYFHRHFATSPVSRCVTQFGAQWIGG